MQLGSRAWKNIWDVLKKWILSEYYYVINLCCSIVYSTLLFLTFTYKSVDVSVHLLYCSYQIYRCHEYQGAYGRIVIDLQEMKVSQQEAMYVLFGI